MLRFGGLRLSIHSSFERGIKNIFQIASYIIILGSILDSISFDDKNKHLFVINFVTALMAVIFLILFYVRLVKWRIAFTILIYNILINIFIGKFLGMRVLDHSASVNFFMRDSLFIFLLLTLAAFTLDRIHALIIGSAYLVVSALLIWHLKDPFLYNSAALLFMTLISYCGLTWYLVGIFENAILDQRHKSRLVRAQSVELLKRNEKLSSLNRSKDMLMAVIGHDLKNPFNVILLSAQILESKYDRLNDEQKKKVIETIRTTSVKTYELLENLLKWARLQTDSFKFNPQTISLTELINESLDFLSENIRRKNILIRFDSTENFLVNADSDMISTVIRNLISNAVKFTHEEGTISVTCLHDGNTVKCIVADDGIGMDKVQLKQLFDIEKFMISKDTDGSSGTGLGLILCREFLLLNRGKMVVESKKGSGSAFSITLPKPGH